MFKKRDIELIVLEVLGCLDNSERESLRFLKKNDENFCWKELGENQNLTALLPSILKIEKPSVETKIVLVRKLNRLIFGKEDIDQTDKLVSVKKVADEGSLEKVLNQNKIDWGSLTVSESTKKSMSGFEEVKPKAPSKSISIDRHDAQLLSEENNPEILVKENKFSTREVNPKSSSTLKKYVLVSVVLFIISVSLGVYLFFYNKPDRQEVFSEQNPIDTVVLPTEEFVYSDLKEFESVPESVVTQKVEVVSDPQVEKDLLPKAPPKLPEPIEAPLIETKEVIAEEESKEEDKISTPPPKEAVEIIEEPNYFVAVEEMPQPIGGLQAIQGKIEYPEIAIRAGVEGKVFVRAFVDETGTVTSAEIVKGIGAGCDEAALDAIQKTKFTPGKQRGKPIKVQVTIPVVFKK